MSSSFSCLILSLCLYRAQQPIEGPEESGEASQLQPIVGFFLPFEGFRVYSVKSE